MSEAGNLLRSGIVLGVAKVNAFGPSSAELVRMIFPVKVANSAEVKVGQLTVARRSPVHR
jgi:hypothetical protein